MKRGDIEFLTDKDKELNDLLGAQWCAQVSAMSKALWDDGLTIEQHFARRRRIRDEMDSLLVEFGQKPTTRWQSTVTGTFDPEALYSWGEITRILGRPLSDYVDPLRYVELPKSEPAASKWRGSVLIEFLKLRANTQAIHKAWGYREPEADE